MADRVGDEAARLALTDLTDALERYLEAKGWQPFVVANPRIEQRAPDAYEFVVPFTGRRWKDDV